MATHVETDEYSGIKRSGGPVFSVWTPIIAVVLSVILAIVAIATAK
jgi:hypothetical protein